MATQAASKLQDKKFFTGFGQHLVPLSFGVFLFLIKNKNENKIKFNVQTPFQTYSWYISVMNNW